MAIIKGRGSVGGSERPSSIKPREAISSGKFEKILNKKTGEATQQSPPSGTSPEGVKAPAAPTAEEIKERLRALIEGGANPDEVVRTALAGHPLVDRLPSRLKKQLVKNVTAVFSPTLGSLTLGSSTLKQKV